MKNIQSGKTAISRRILSAPLSKMLNTKKLFVDDKVFDFGHGRGDDMVKLREMGYTVAGWDPNHFLEGYSVEKVEDAPWRPDFIYCGYVLNILESRDLRVSVAKDIYDMLAMGSGRACVATRSFREVARSRNDSWEAHEDGWVTSAGTFQHGLTPEELVSIMSEAGFENIHVLCKNPVIVVVEK